MGQRVKADACYQGHTLGGVVEALAGIFKGLVVAFGGSAPSRPSMQGAGVYTAPVASSSLGLCVFCCLLWLQISFFFFFWSLFNGMNLMVSSF